MKASPGGIPTAARTAGTTPTSELYSAWMNALYNSLVGIVPAVLAAVGIPPGLAFIGFVLGYQSFWFGLLYRKVLAYRAYYESISPAKLTSGT